MIEAKSIREWADALDAAERMGSMEDSPEGARYIQISDTLARQIAADLRLFADSIVTFESHEIVVGPLPPGGCVPLEDH